MDASHFAPLVDWLNAHPDWIFITIALIAFIESLALAGVVVPGVLLLFLVAAVAGGGSLSLEMALLAGFIGAVLGDGISFLIGHYFKDRLNDKWPFKNYPKMMATGRDYFLQHGGKSVVIGRFVGPLRPVLPIIAGMFGMSIRRFFTFNILSACAWSPVYILPGYMAGAATKLPLPENFYSALGILGATLIVAIIVFRWCSLNLQVGGSLYQALEAKKEHSTFFNWLWQWTTQHNSLTKEFPLASIMLCIISSVLFWLLTILVTQTETMQAIDLVTNELTVSLSNAYLVSIASVITLLGDRGFLYISFTLFVLMLLAKRNYIAAVHVIAAGLAMDLVTHQLKDLFAIPRPEFVTSPPDSFAFPSGHTSGATIFYGLVASFIAQEFPPKNRWHIYLGFSIPIILIAISRVALNVHWLSDIIGGFLLGLAMCGLTRAIFSRFEKRSLYFENKITNMYFVFVWLALGTAYVIWQHPSTTVAFSPL